MSVVAELAASPALTTPDRSCAIYVRRSSASGGGANHSLREQEAEARGLAQRHDLTVVRVYVEREGTGASHYSGKRRPEWDAALRDLDAGSEFRTVITAALDRADRRGADVLGTLLTKHAVTGRRVLTLDGVDTSNADQRTNTILRGEIAREEAARLSARVSRTKRYRREEGRWLGGRPPFGLKVGTVTDPATNTSVSTGRLAHDPQTYETARRIADDLLRGKTLWEVVARLNAEAVPAPRAASWRVPSLAALVRSPAWAGLQGVRERTRRTDGTWSPWPAVAEVYRSETTREPVSIGEGVITPDERTLILEAIKSRSAGYVRVTPNGDDERRRRGVRPVRNLLAGVLRCPDCGGRACVSGVSVRCATAAQGAHRRQGFTAPLDAIEAHVALRALTRLTTLDPASPDDLTTLLAVAAAWQGESDVATKARRVALEARIVELHDEDRRAVSLALSGVLSGDEARSARDDVAARLAAVQADLRAIREASVDPGALLDLALVGDVWDDLPRPDQRRVVEALVERVTVARAPRRGVRFDSASRVTIVWREAA